MVRYYNEDVHFMLKGRRFNSHWLSQVAAHEGKRLGKISIIYCSDAYILEMNRKYLNHDYYTDIITFDYDEGDIISGDLYISIDSVRENASFFGATFENELCRVMVHGILHLLGFDDDTKAQQKQMRAKEDEYLSLRDKLLAEA